MKKTTIKHQSFTAFSWCAGWLFTIGFLDLAFWKGLLAIILWPYYIGVEISMLI